MAKGRKAEKVDDTIEVNPEESSEAGSQAGSYGMGDVMSKEAQMHIFKALTELAAAFEGMVPRNRFPEEAKKHGKAAKKEFLLMMRSLIDAEIECVERGKGKSEPKLKKIKVE